MVIVYILLSIIPSALLFGYLLSLPYGAFAGAVFLCAYGLFVLKQLTAAEAN